MPLPKRLAALPLRDYAVLIHLSMGYPSLWGRYKLVTHPFATDQKESKLPLITVRLACVRRTASVHPEL